MGRNRQLVWITPVHFDRFGRPIDPDYGVDEGGHPDQGLPGGGWGGERPDQGLPGGGWGGRPPRPDQGLPGGGLHPGHRPPGSGEHPGHRPPRPERPIDPGFGLPDDGTPPTAGQLPVWPMDPSHPDNTLPPAPDQGLPTPPTNPPPGTVWPPLPPGAPTGKALLLAWVQGVGYRYVVVELKPPVPDQGLPAGGAPQPKR
jgi:hypothetical protein